MSDVAPATGIRTAIDRASVPILLVRLAVGGFFIYMGMKKTVEPGDFLKVIKAYELLPLDPPHFVNLTAIALPWLEILSGFALVSGLFLRAGSLAIALMLAIFTPAILYRALQLPDYVNGTLAFMQLEFDCGCGAGPQVIWQKLVENSFLFIFTLPVLLCRTHGFRLPLAWASAARA